MTINKKFLSTALLTATLALTAMGAAALSENQVISAPDVTLSTIQETIIPETYRPEANYYMDQELDFDPAGYVPELSKPEDGSEALYLNITQTPGLTASEAQRAQNLLADYKEGKRKADGKAIIGAQDNVQLGVYQIPAKDYEGESIYTILPGTMLTDDQLLQLIDAYHQLGQSFDPQGLNYLNCMRGGGMESTRYATQGEYERSPLLARLQRRQGMKADQPFTPSPSDDGNGYVHLDSKYFDGLQGFSFYPYRSRTDSELMALNAYDKPIHDSAVTPIIDASFPWAQAEQAARQAAAKTLKAGAALELTDERLSGDGAYLATLESPMIDGQSEVISLVLTQDLKSIESASRFLYLQTTLAVADQGQPQLSDQEQAKYIELSKAYVGSLQGKEAIQEAKFLGLTVGDFGTSAVTLVTLADQSSYRLTISLLSEAPQVIEYNRVAVPGLDAPGL